jgi:hypothetical protein
VFIDRARTHFDAAFAAQEIQHLFEDRPDQGGAFDHRAQSQHTGLVHVLLEQLSEEGQAESCLGDRLRPRCGAAGANGDGILIVDRSEVRHWLHVLTSTR